MLREIENFVKCRVGVEKNFDIPDKGVEFYGNSIENIVQHFTSFIAEAFCLADTTTRA